ncbi:MAG: DUF1570 domain-containing protein [Sphingobacteriaceae bacterium]
MKFLHLSLVLFLFSSTVFSQKLIINEVGFKLKDEDRKNIELMAQYEAKIFNGLFDTRINDSLTIVLNLYKKSKDYNVVRKEATNVGVHNTGFYSPAKREIFMLYQGMENFGTTLHEMSHAFLHNNMARPPRWLHEGLAEFFRTLTVVNNEVQVSTLPYHIKYVKTQITEGKLNLDEFFNRGNSSWVGSSNQQYMYAVSYSVVFYMISKKPELMKAVIAELKKRNNIETTITKIYGGIDKLEIDYKFFYKYKYN